MIQSILTMFAFGTIGFWILIAVVNIMFISLIENEHRIFPAVVLIMLGLIYWKSLVALELTWQMVLLYCIGYLVLGVIWSLYRWYKYAKKVIAEHKNKSYEDRVNSVKDDLKLDYENKEKIIGWIVYWPWSLFWNCTEDLFESIFNSMKNTYNKITDKAISKFINLNVK